VEHKGENREEVFVDTHRVFCLSLLENYFRIVCNEVESVDYVEDIEHMLWKAVHGDPEEMEHWRIDERDVIMLKMISREIGGWLLAKPATRSGYKRTYQYVSTPSWERRFESWKEKVL
jgi:hypothetical protein